MSTSQVITVQELVALALPVQARVLTHGVSLDRPVAWVVSTTWADSMPKLLPGDFVLLLPPYAANLSAQLARFAQLGIAGMAVVGEPLPALIDAAEHAGVPLFTLPESSDLRQIERSALEVVLERRTAIEKRATQLYQQLAVLSAENVGLEAMATLIGQTTGKSVLIQDKRLDILAGWFAPDTAAWQQDIAHWTSVSANLPEQFSDRKRAAQTPSILEQALSIENLTRLIAPIVAKGMARGFLSLIAPANALGIFERRVVEQSAAACALEMAKAKAVSEAEKRVRGSFIDAMLSGSLSPLEAARWAKRHKYDPDGQHAAIVVDWARKEHPSYRRLETSVHGLGGGSRGAVLMQARENEVVILGRLEAKAGIDTARHIAENIRRQAHAEFPNDPLAIGIGRPVDALIGLRDSYREARQALSMARRLAEPGPLYFGELNVYRLLFQLEHSPELASFCQETIGTLIEYDRAQRTDWVETLSAYFAHKGNLSRTAEALFVHRNTLLYRMERIREISGLDLNNPETRLSIQLALRAHRLLMVREE